MSDEQRLRDSFKSAFGTAAGDPGSITFGSSAWDSVAHIALVTELETSFGLELTPEEITELTSFSKAKEILGRYGVRFAA
jgi:acyl carrier protein